MPPKNLPYMVQYLQDPEVPIDIQMIRPHNDGFSIFDVGSVWFVVVCPLGKSNNVPIMNHPQWLCPRCMCQCHYMPVQHRIPQFHQQWSYHMSTSNPFKNHGKSLSDHHHHHHHHHHHPLSLSLFIAVSVRSAIILMAIILCKFVMFHDNPTTSRFIGNSYRHITSSDFFLLLEITVFFVPLLGPVRGFHGNCRCQEEMRLSLAPQALQILSLGLIWVSVPWISDPSSFAEGDEHFSCFVSPLGHPPFGKHRCPFPIGWLINKGCVYPFNNR